MSCCFEGISASTQSNKKQTTQSTAKKIASPAKVTKAENSLRNMHKALKALRDSRKKMLGALKELQRSLQNHKDVDDGMKIGSAICAVAAVPIIFFNPPLGIGIAAYAGGVSVTADVHKWGNEYLGTKTLDEFIEKDKMLQQDVELTTMKFSVDMGALMLDLKNDDFTTVCNATVWKTGVTLYSSQSAYYSAMHAMELAHLSKVAKNLGYVGTIRAGTGTGVAIKSVLGTGMPSWATSGLKDIHVVCEEGYRLCQVTVFASKWVKGFAAVGAVLSVKDAYDSFNTQGPTQQNVKKAIKMFEDSLNKLNKAADGK